MPRASEEYQRRQWQGERDAQHGQAGADAYGVDQGDQHGGAHVGDQGVPGVVPGPGRRMRALRGSSRQRKVRPRIFSAMPPP
jgi:hypothetical protein